MLTARAGIEGVTLVRVRDVHDAVDDDRRDLEAAAPSQREDPCGRQARDVGRVDLVDRAEAIAAVGWPL